MMKNSSIPSLEEQIANLKKMDDKDIDFSDIPEIRDFTRLEQSKFYRPIKTAVTLRLDADVLEWFKYHHPSTKPPLTPLCASISTNYAFCCAY